jgi:hypothetical protein
VNPIFGVSVYFEETLANGTFWYHDKPGVEHDSFSCSDKSWPHVDINKATWDQAKEAL